MSSSANRKSLIDFRNVVAATIVLPILWCQSIAAQTPQDSIRFIEVIGIADLSPTPDRAKISVSIVAGGDTAVEAAQEYLKKRQAFIDAMGPMNHPEIELRLGIPAITQSIPNEMMEQLGGVLGDQGGTEGAFEYREIIVLETELEDDPIKTAEKLGQIVDACVDADGQLENQSLQSMLMGGGESQPFIELIHTKSVERKQQANQQAFENAKQEAQSLAELSGVRLGPVLQISFHSDVNSAQADWIAMFAESGQPKQDHSVRLRVRFAIGSKDRN